MHSPDRRRRQLLLAPLGFSALGLVACGSSPPVRLHRLPLQADSVSATPPAPAPAQDAERWELVRDVALPEYLQRELMLVDIGDGRLQALQHDRWAEPLQDAVPRVLLHELSLLRGADRVWAAPAPAGTPVQQRLRVQILALDAQAAQARLVLQARCTWLALQPGMTSRVQSVALEVPLAGAGAGALVAAHRAALRALALRIVGP